MFLPANCSDENLALCWEHCFSILHPSHVVAVLFTVTWILGVGCISFLFLISSELFCFFPDRWISGDRAVSPVLLFCWHLLSQGRPSVPISCYSPSPAFDNWFLAVSLCQSCRLSLHSPGFSVPYLLLLSHSGLSPFLAARPYHDPLLYALHDYNVYILLFDPYFL